MAEKVTEKDIFNENFNIKNMSTEELYKAYEIVMAKADVLRYTMATRKNASRKFKEANSNSSSN